MPPPQAAPALASHFLFSAQCQFCRHSERARAVWSGGCAGGDPTQAGVCERCQPPKPDRRNELCPALPCQLQGLQPGACTGWARSRLLAEPNCAQRLLNPVPARALAPLLERRASSPAPQGERRRTCHSMPKETPRMEPMMISFAALTCTQESALH